LKGLVGGPVLVGGLGPMGPPKSGPAAGAWVLDLFLTTVHTRSYSSKNI